MPPELNRGRIMPNTSAISVLYLVLFIFVASSASSVGAATTAFMATGNQTSQPIGHYQFCIDRPDECNIRSQNPAPIVLSESRWADLQQVNNLVNSAIRPATDLEMFGVLEEWAYPATRGDCEDYVLLKRRILAESGWPLGSLLITVVLRPDGEGHAVLTVRTDRGDLVLDNLDSHIMLWTDTPYLFVKRQSEENTGRWVAIEDGRGAVVQFVGE